MDLTLEGDVAALRLEGLIDLLARSGQGGVLTIHGGLRPLRVGFDDGRLLLPVVAPERERALAEAAAELRGAVTWRHARYVFETCRLRTGPEAGDWCVEVDPTALLMEVARQLDEDPPRGGREPRSRSLAPGRLEGDLDVVGLPALVQALLAGGRSGVLVVMAGRRREALCLAGGRLLVADPAEPEDAGFTRLVLGFSAARCLNELARRGLGDAPATVRDEARAAAHARLLEVIFWRRARFCFVAARRSLHHLEGEGWTSLDTDAFLLDAVRRLGAWEPLRALCAPDAVFRFAGPEAKLEALRAGEHPELLTLVDGVRPFDDLVRVSRVPRLEAARVLAALFSRGAVMRYASAALTPGRSRRRRPPPPRPVRPRAARRGGAPAGER